MESTGVDSDRLLRQVESFSAATVELRSALDRVNRMRDEAIRQLDETDTITRVALAQLVGIDRSRLYVILANVDDDDEDGQLWLHHSMQQLTDETIARWSEDGGHGDIGDYFPIEDVLRAP